MDVLWSDPAQPSRGPKPGLTVVAIADAAVRIADAEGLAAVSMQRVAADLGFTKMSLYRYLPGKAELVALMVERAMGAPPDAAPPWRPGLVQWARLLLAGLVRHPWVLEATVGPHPVGPHELGWMDRGLGLLAGTPLTGAERLDALVVLTGHVRMIAQQAAAAGGGAEQGITDGIGPLLARHGERFPALVEALSDTGPGERDQAFDFGLDCILAGLGAVIDARSRDVVAEGTRQAPR